MAQSPEQPSQLEADRRAKLDAIRKLGLDPFGGRVDGLINLAAAKSQFKEEHGSDAGPRVKVAGRIIFRRDIGKLVFIRLRDDSGDLQIGLDKKRLSQGSAVGGQQSAVKTNNAESSTADRPPQTADLQWQLAGLLDLGDQIVVEGPLGRTKTGEITVWADRLEIAAKSLLPPPAKWEGLTDVEARYRQRYVDLWANPEVMQLAQTRVRIIDEIRSFLRARGFLEVETPMLQPIHGGAAARPFKTHHNALNMPLYLRIAPELYLKRLLVGGMRKVFEINRNFRNEGVSPRHNPEFTMLEAYDAFGSWETMAELVEEMICTVARNVLGTLKIVHRNEDGTEKTIDLSNRPWPRVPMAELVEKATGWKFDKKPIPDKFIEIIKLKLEVQWTIRRLSPIRSVIDLTQFEQVTSIAQIRDIVRIELARAEHEQRAQNERIAVLLQRLSSLPESSDEAKKTHAEMQLEVAAENVARRAVNYLTQVDSKHYRTADEFGLRITRLSPAEQLVDVYESLIEPTLINPCFVTRVPGVIIPLARRCRDDDYFADVYELAINGQEISPGYTELNDPDVQAEHFRHQVGDREEQQQVDEDFLTALKFGMPPAGGIGLGIDRLVMMLTGAPSIRDVILFPLMRPR